MDLHRVQPPPESCTCADENLTLPPNLNSHRSLYTFIALHISLPPKTSTHTDLGGRPSMDHMAKYPLSPTASTPQTPAGATGRRKIRCKMCRRNLATREHMMDHILAQSGGPATRPATPSAFALPQPLTTTEDATFQPLERSNSVSSVINPLTGLPGARSRRASNASSRRPSLGAMSAISDGTTRSRSRSVLGNDGQLTMSRRDSSGSATGPSGLAPMTSPEAVKSEGGRPPTPPLPSDSKKEEKEPKEHKEEKKEEKKGPGGRPMLDADALAARLPPQLAALRAGFSATSNLSSPIASSPPSSPESELPPARRRPSNLGMTSMPQPLTPAALSALTQAHAQQAAQNGPPILTNNKCSGYFVEPLTWMEPALNGQVSGKLFCPCGAKIGTFDWAGVQCGCKEWVTPGFCIHRSRVDEVW